MLLLTLSVLTLLAQAQLPATPPPSALIVGRVVDAGTGSPIAGAIVQINGGGAPIVGQGLPRVMTNASGQFVVRGLRKGSVFLTVTERGYVTASYGQLRPRGDSRPVVISADDAHVTGIELRMWKYGTIGGTIVDEQGEPVVGASVQAIQRTYVGGRPRFGGFTIGATTDDRGMYAFGSLLPGDYAVAVITTISAMPTETIDRAMRGDPNDPLRMDLFRAMAMTRAPLAQPGTPYAIGIGNLSVGAQESTGPMPQADGSLLVYPLVFYPSAAHIGEAGVVTVRSGEHRGGVDVALHPAHAVTVSGSVLGPDGPVPNTAVHLTPAEGEAAADPIDAAVALTDGSGGFTLVGVPPGQYTLRIAQIPSTPSAAPVTTIVQSGSTTIGFSSSGPPVGPPPPVPTAPTLSVNAPISVGTANITGLIVPVKSGGRVTGRVEFDGTADKPEPRALTNMRIRAETADGSRLDPFMAITLTGHPDESGAFTTVGMPAGEYVLRVDGAPPHWFLRSAMYKGRDLLDSAVAVNSTDISGVVITLTDKTQALKGTVRDGQDADADATVLVFPSDAESWGSSGPSPRRFRTVRVGADGSYAMNNLPAGDYDLVALKGDPGDAWQDPALLTSLAGVATAIHLGEGDSKTQDLKSNPIR